MCARQLVAGGPVNRANTRSSAAVVGPGFEFGDFEMMSERPEQDRGPDGENCRAGSGDYLKMFFFARIHTAKRR
jgi:hypothetical protein